ncbi:glycosyltransferase [candidate division WWE3 bacterium]|uniref:Glycosyltransferase n=1 Tax=candidate division WWE3 bacterium TaxID=2053526 RepID=A0A7X9E7C0_UNCKA|nr:glycosyltransferase [candidate division WWE3 bacterium]
MPFKILSLPARHPYMRKFNDGVNIEFVNPDTDLFSQQQYDPEVIQAKYPPESYNIVHIHFSFDVVPIDRFRNLLEYFRSVQKPIIWTTHSLECQRIKGYGNGEYQKLLFDYADKLISPTEGCKKYILEKYGKHKRDIDVIPLGFMISPGDVERIKKGISKDKNLFTILIADFRENREVIQSVINFLQCSTLNDCKLQLIYKPINPYKSSTNDLNEVMITFYELTQNPRIINVSLPFIPNELITEAFLKSHAIILPYKWGTHSGQIEQAKDCGCHVVVTDVGYYKEQWDKINTWSIADNKVEEFPTRYTNCLMEVYKKEPLKPAGYSRQEELQRIIQQHVVVYKNLISTHEQK